MSERLAQIEAEWHQTGMSESGFDWNLCGYELLQALKSEHKRITKLKGHVEDWHDHKITAPEAMVEISQILEVQ
jgi:hypothetical protein